MLVSVARRCKLGVVSKIPSDNSSSADITTQTFSLLKGERPIVAVTAYDAPTARYADEAGVDLILVGDSLGTTVLGFDSTVPVTLEMMLHHTAAVTRQRPGALVVADVPYTLAHERFVDLLRACRRLIQEGGADAVKIEGGAEMASKIERLTRAGIPVLGHIGLLPQQVKVIGGYRKFGRSNAEKEILTNDGMALESAGCFAIIAEMVEGTVAGAIASQLTIPLIGIGSGPHCDGQILVVHDLLGMNPGRVPSFVKVYAQIGDAMREGISQYADEVRSNRFPL